MSWAIGKKIDIFENESELKADARTINKDNSFKQMNDTRRHGKNMSKVVINGDDPANSFEKGLSMEDISRIINEFRNIDTDVKKGRIDRSADGSKTFARPSYTSSRTLGEMKERKLDGSSREVKDMIVRRVKCGLKEPKPVRLVEIRRIIYLCGGQLRTPRVKRRTVSEPPGP
jgi:hypothetical protein